jgi:hypothetical protein
VGLDKAHLLGHLDFWGRKITISSFITLFNLAIISSFSVTGISEDVWLLALALDFKEIFFFPIRGEYLLRLLWYGGLSYRLELNCILDVGKGPEIVLGFFVFVFVFVL